MLIARQSTTALMDGRRRKTIFGRCGGSNGTPFRSKPFSHQKRAFLTGAAKILNVMISFQSFLCIYVSTETEKNQALKDVLSVLFPH